MLFISNHSLTMIHLISLFLWFSCFFLLENVIIMMFTVQVYGDSFFVAFSFLAIINRVKRVYKRLFLQNDCSFLSSFTWCQSSSFVSEEKILAFISIIFIIHQSFSSSESLYKRREMSCVKRELVWSLIGGVKREARHVCRVFFSCSVCCLVVDSCSIICLCLSSFSFSSPWPKKIKLLSAGRREIKQQTLLPSRDERKSELKEERTTEIWNSKYE